MRFLMVTSILLLPLLGAPLPAQEQHFVARVRVGFDMDAAPQAILSAILSGTHLSGGIAVRRGCDETKQIHLKIEKNAPVAEALNQLVKQMPGYRWLRQDNVVNVLPLTDVPLLNVQIARVEIDLEHVMDSIVKLRRVKEIHARASELGLAPGLLIVPGPGIACSSSCAEPQPERYRRRVLRDQTLVETLNAIVVSRNAVWVYVEAICGGKGEFNLTSMHI